MTAFVNMMVRLVVLLVIFTTAAALVPSKAFTRVVGGRVELRRDYESKEVVIPGTRQGKLEIMEAGMFVGPQIAFVTAIVGAFICYIAANIDDIKIKQKVATDAAMAQQSTDIKDAMSKQQESIKKARESQERAIAEARKKAEDALKRK